jgi:hypothetical protein
MHITMDIPECIACAVYASVCGMVCVVWCGVVCCPAGLFCSTHKTVAMGIPLITTIFEDSPSLGLYTLPLLMYHPMQVGGYVTADSQQCQC